MTDYSLEDLKTLMARLRDPDKGCPWDIKQDFASIVPHTLEEAHEVADAIERADYPHLKDELGDLLFQVIFYARLGDEAGHFDFDDIVDNLVAKLLRRHPHVFPDGTLASVRATDAPPEEAEIKANWERIKAAERASQPGGETEERDRSALAGIAATLPALARAEKLQRRAAALGFDWDEVGQVFAKLEEEADEIRDAVASDDPDAVEDEVGDLFFVCVNLARFLKVNPEQALRRANRKFEKRFRLMEDELQRREASFSSYDMEQLEALWQAAKRQR